PRERPVFLLSIGMDEPLDNADSSLSAATAEAVIERAVESTAIGMPLAAGLRIAAEEGDSRPLASALEKMARDVERGRSLTQIVDGNSARLPGHLAGLVRAAQRTGQLPLVLAEWLESRRVARQHWEKVVTAMTYPMILFLLSIGVYIVLAGFVVQPIKIIV